jgi:hypothetical protein
MEGSWISDWCRSACASVCVISISIKVIIKKKHLSKYQMKKINVSTKHMFQSHQCTHVHLCGVCRCVCRVCVVCMTRVRHARERVVYWYSIQYPLHLRVSASQRPRIRVHDMCASSAFVTAGARSKEPGRMNTRYNNSK